MTIDVTGLDLRAFIRKAYELSEPVGIGFLHYRTGPIPEHIVDKLIEGGKDSSSFAVVMDYVLGRRVKMIVYRDLEDPEKLSVADEWDDHSHDDLVELLGTVGIGIHWFDKMRDQFGVAVPFETCNFDPPPNKIKLETWYRDTTDRHTYERHFRWLSLEWNLWKGRAKGEPGHFKAIIIVRHGHERKHVWDLLLQYAEREKWSLVTVNPHQHKLMLCGLANSHDVTGFVEVATAAQMKHNPFADPLHYLGITDAYVVGHRMFERIMVAMHMPGVRCVGLFQGVWPAW